MLKPVIIVAIVFVLLSSTIILVMGQPYTSEQVESVTKNTLKQANDNPEAWKYHNFDLFHSMNSNHL